MPGHEVLTGWPARYEAIIKAIGPGQKLCNVRHGPESVRTWDIPQAFGPVTAAERDILEAIARNRRHRKYGTIPNGNPLPVPVIEELTGQHDLGPVLDGLCQRGFAKALTGGYDLRGGLFCSGQFRRPAWDAPAPTVLTGFGNPRYFLHPLEDRPFSLREAARLQGFPDSSSSARRACRCRTRSGWSATPCRRRWPAPWPARSPPRWPRARPAAGLSAD